MSGETKVSVTTRGFVMLVGSYRKLGADPEGDAEKVKIS